MSAQHSAEADDHDAQVEEDTSCFRVFPRSLCHPAYALHRYFVLFFMCMLGFGKLCSSRQ